MPSPTPAQRPPDVVEPAADTSKTAPQRVVGALEDPLQRFALCSPLVASAAMMPRRQTASPIQRKATIGVEAPFQAPAHTTDAAALALLADPTARRFRSDREFLRFAANPASVENAGVTAGGDFVRVDEFTVLGENHGAPLAPAILNALGTNKFRYEGFLKIDSARREAHDNALGDQLGANDARRVAHLGLNVPNLNARRHDVEGPTSKYARALPDIKSVISQQAAGHGGQYAAIGAAWAPGYALTKTLVAVYLEVLLYVQSYSGKIFSHPLKTFATANEADITLGINTLQTADGAQVVPDLSQGLDDGQLDELITIFTTKAQSKVGLANEDARDDFKASLRLYGEPRVAITDEAKENDYLRDKAMFDTLKAAKRAGDLLFIIGDAHRHKLRNLVQGEGIPIMTDGEFMNQERGRNAATPP